MRISRKMKKVNLTNLILMILSAITVFIIGNFIGLIFAFISLIISIKNYKNKDKLNLIILISDIIIILVSIFLFYTAFNNVDTRLNTAKSSARKVQEELVETYCVEYASQMLSSNEIKEGENIIQKDLLTKYNIKYPQDCEIYVIANIVSNNVKESIFKTYLQCKEYKTDNFDINKLK